MYLHWAKPPIDLIQRHSNLRKFRQTFRTLNMYTTCTCTCLQSLTNTLLPLIFFFCKKITCLTSLCMSYVDEEVHHFCMLQQINKSQMPREVCFTIIMKLVQFVFFFNLMWRIRKENRKLNTLRNITACFRQFFLFYNISVVLQKLHIYLSVCFTINI